MGQEFVKPGNAPPWLGELVFTAAAKVFSSSTQVCSIHCLGVQPPSQGGSLVGEWIAFYHSHLTPRHGGVGVGREAAGVHCCSFSSSSSRCCCAAQLRNMHEQGGKGREAWGGGLWYEE
jgi:hypothetical protein